MQAQAARASGASHAVHPAMPLQQEDIRNALVCLDLISMISKVRRNAVLAVFTIYKNFEMLIPDAPELIHDFLEQETVRVSVHTCGEPKHVFQDASCKRNGFMMLIAVDQNRALDYLSTCIDQVQGFNEILQLVIVELVRKVKLAAQVRYTPHTVTRCAVPTPASVRDSSASSTTCWTRPQLPSGSLHTLLRLLTYL